MCGYVQYWGVISSTQHHEIIRKWWPFLTQEVRNVLRADLGWHGSRRYRRRPWRLFLNLEMKKKALKRAKICRKRPKSSQNGKKMSLGLTQCKCGKVNLNHITDITQNGMTFKKPNFNFTKHKQTCVESQVFEISSSFIYTALVSQIFLDIFSCYIFIPYQC